MELIKIKETLEKARKLSEKIEAATLLALTNEEKLELGY